MKILHFSDTHLGLGLENTSREDDFYHNFSLVIDEVLRLKPDLVIHSWDLFHTSKPSNKALSIAITHFMKIQKAGIPFVLIAGNHDTPRLSLTTHPFEIFQEFENMYLAYEPRAHEFEIGDFHISALPHAHEQSVFEAEFKKAQLSKIDNKINIFVGHFWLQAKEYDEYTDEISGVNIKTEELEALKTFDYVALGHYHRHFFMGNMSYSWSIEHTSFNQRNSEIWANIITFEKGKILKEHLSLTARPMLDLKEFDTTWMENMDVLSDWLSHFLEWKNIEGAIVRILFTELSQALLMDFQDRKLKELFASCFHFEYKKLKAQEAGRSRESVIQTSQNLIVDNFPRFFETYPISPSLPKEKIEAKLQEILFQITS